MKLLHEIIEAAQKQGQFRPNLGGPLLFSDQKGRFSFSLDGYWVPLPVQDIPNEAGFVDLKRRLILTVHVRDVPEGTSPKEAAEKSNSLFSQWKGFNAWREVLADKPERFVEKTSYLRVDPNTLSEQTSTLAYLFHVVLKTTCVLVLLRADPEEDGALSATIKEAIRGVRENPQTQGGYPAAPQPGPPAPAGAPIRQPIPPYNQGPPPGYGVPGQHPGAPGALSPYGAPPAPPAFPGQTMPPQTGYPQATLYAPPQPPPQPPQATLYAPPQVQPQAPAPTAPAASPSGWPPDAEAIIVSFPPLSASFALPCAWQLLRQTPDRARLIAENEPGMLLVHAGLYPDLASLGAALPRLFAEHNLHVSPTEALREEAATPQGSPVVAAYQGQDSQGKPLAIRYRAHRASHGTALGALAIAEPTQIEHLSTRLEELARSFRLSRIVANQTAVARLLGSWNQSPWQGTHERASYTFEAEGAYLLRRQRGQSPAGVEIREEDAQVVENGRCFVSQGALVLSSQSGSRVLSMQLEGDTLRLGDASFTRAVG